MEASRQEWQKNHPLSDEAWLEIQEEERQERERERERKTRYDQTENDAIEDMTDAGDGIRYDSQGRQWILLDSQGKPMNTKLRMQWADRDYRLEDLSHKLEHERSARETAEMRASNAQHEARIARNRNRNRNLYY